MVAQFVETNVPRTKPFFDSSARNLSVVVGSGDALDVRHFHVTEKMSTIFEVKIVAVCENHDIDFEAVVGQPMNFAVQERHTRTWTGVCNHLQQIGIEERGLSTYELTLVPTLWLLTQRRNHRMFQQMSEIDIVQKLLGEWGIQPEMRLGGSYKKRKYKVQYSETDETFIRRMLEEAGVSFYFDDASGESKLVLDDGPQRNEARAPIAFREKPTVADREHVTAVCVGRRLRPGKVTMRDHDYRKPPDYKLLSSASGASGVEAQMESFHYAPGAFLFEGGKSDGSMADSKGAYRTDEGEGTSLAQRRLDGARATARTVSFKTNAHDLSPGRVLSVVDHPKSELAAGKRLLVAESCFSGTHDGEWSHDVTTVSGETPYRPEVKTPAPKVSGVESATVVGPPGEEIHVDQFGRVQVHFHWDRESQMDDKSSCWIHVSQPWGGAGFGGTALPRVGQEVIVDFLDGNPDRPVITGRVYTNLQQTPYKLPDNKTQTGLKSNSTNKTGGYNELMFEDAAGKELVRMQAEKDLKKLVKNDEQVKIGRDREKKIARDDSHEVGRDRKRSVTRDETVSIGQDRTRRVGRDESVDVGQDQTKSIGRNRDLSVGQDLTKNVGRDLTKDVGSNERETTGQNRTISVGQNRTADIGLVDSTSVGEKVYIEVKLPEGELEEANDDLGDVEGLADGFVQSVASLGAMGGFGGAGLAGGAVSVLQGLAGGGAGGALGALAAMAGDAAGGGAGAVIGAVAGMAGGAGGDGAGVGAVKNMMAGAAQGGGAAGGGAHAVVNALAGVIADGGNKGGSAGALVSKLTVAVQGGISATGGGTGSGGTDAIVQAAAGWARSVGGDGGESTGGGNPQGFVQALAGMIAASAEKGSGGPPPEALQTIAQLIQNGGEGVPPEIMNAFAGMLQGGGGGPSGSGDGSSVGAEGAAGAAMNAIAGMMQGGGGDGTAGAAMNAIAGMMQGGVGDGTAGAAMNAIAGMMQGGAGGAMGTLAGMAKAGSLPGLGGLTGMLGGEDARGALASALGKAANAKFGEGLLAGKASGAEQAAEKGEGSKATPTSITMVHKKITITTGHGATITMDGAKVTIEADTIEFFAKKNIEADAEEKDVTIHAKTDIALNSDQTIHAATQKGVIEVNASEGNVAIDSNKSVVITATAGFFAGANACTIQGKTSAFVNGGDSAIMKATNVAIDAGTELKTSGKSASHTAEEGLVVAAGGETKIAGKTVNINP